MAGSVDKAVLDGVTRALVRRASELEPGSGNRHERRASAAQERKTSTDSPPGVPGRKE